MLLLTVAYTGKELKLDFQQELKNFNLKDISSFYPKWMGTLEGISTGSVQGTIGQLNGEPTYSVNLGLNIQNGYWHGINFTPYTQNIVNKLSSLSLLESILEGKKLKVSNKFKKFSLKGVFSQEQWNFEKYSYISDGLAFNGRKGKIYLPPSKKKSTLSMIVDWKILRPALSENFARSNLPLRLSGNGFGLMPDVSFVAKKLAKSHLKKRSRKIIRNSKEKAIEKINNEKLKGLLKGVL